jgi:hypothetical protein
MADTACHIYLEACRVALPAQSDAAREAALDYWRHARELQGDHGWAVEAELGGASGRADRGALSSAGSGAGGDR